MNPYLEEEKEYKKSVAFKNPRTKDQHKSLYNFVDEFYR